MCLKKFLLKRFRINYLRDLKYFLDIQIFRSKKRIFMSRRKYALDILQDSGLMSAQPEKFPMEQNLKLTLTDRILLSDPIKYRKLVYSVHTLSQFMQEPRRPHWDATIRILKYIGQGLLLPSNNSHNLKAFCDSVWGGYRATRSVTGYCVFLRNSIISRKSKKQN